MAIGRKAAETFAQKVIRKSNETKVIAAAQAYIDASETAYAAYVPMKIQHIAVLFPEALYGRNSIGVNYRGQHLALYFHLQRYEGHLPNGWGGIEIGTHKFTPYSYAPFFKNIAPNKLFDAVVEARDVLVALVKDIDTQQIKLAAMVQSFASWKALARGWPELAPHIAAHHLEPRAPSTALVDIAKANAMFGLPIPEVTP